MRPRTSWPVCPTSWSTSENGDDGHDDHRERDEREAVHRRIFADASAAVRSRDYVRRHAWADTAPMIWPVAALAVFLLGFVVYGSVLQARVEADSRGVLERTPASIPTSPNVLA